MIKTHDNDLSYKTQHNTLFFEWFFDNPVIYWDAGIMLVKDLNHKFIASNNIFSLYSGRKPKDIIGLNDEDMPWAESKNIYINHEKDILSGQDYSVIEPLNGIAKINLLTKKKVIYSKAGVPAGTIATANIFNGNVEYGNLSGNAGKVKISSYPGFELTTSESKVLYFLLKGFSRRRVAELSDISVDAYDFHLKNLKMKFKVSNLDDLIFICYERGFHDLIPFQSIII
ncbi:helix-turn-helix transcriptional regulator [Yersinia mollaretii]|uniref:helix-turn-helix transcriptional regulator n=1 Tax=Yersinia mollaretii TaxID=33060 RepID=UPI0011A6D715|nr:LuxR C-terminal-related transcriptional regulator [Yersinia mollaretii]